MEEKKTAKPNVSLYRKVIETKSSQGDLQKQVILDLSPWEFVNPKTGDISRGFSLKIGTLKIGFGTSPTKSSQIFLDATDERIMKAINEAFAVVRSSVKK